MRSRRLAPLWIALALAGSVAAAERAPDAPVRTAKERLSGKAADEQRVNDCKVPAALRGSRPRPDACRPAPRRAPAR